MHYTTNSNIDYIHLGNNCPEKRQDKESSASQKYNKKEDSNTHWLSLHITYIICNYKSNDRY